MTEFLQQELECAYGIDDAKVEWDLGYSQRDHATFRATPRIERMAERNEVLAKLARAAEVLMAAAGNEELLEWEVLMHPDYGCNLTFRAYPHEFPESWGLLEQIADAMEQTVLRIYRLACRELKTLGYQEIEYKQSDEYLDELLRASEQYLFDENGEPEDA